MSATDAQAVVVGDGISGLTVATLLQQQGVDTLLVGPHDGALEPAGPIGARTFNLTPASRNILEHAGAWSRLEAGRCGHFDAIAVWQPGLQQDLNFVPPPEHQAAMGWIVEQAALLHAAHLAYQAAGGRRVTAQVETLEDIHAPTLILADGRSLRAQLIVGADGAHSRVRDAAGLEVAVRDFNQRALTANVETALAHGNVARQIFLPSGPLAFLPLAGACQLAIVWSCELGLADELEQLDSTAFAARLGAAFEHRLGDVTTVAARRSFPLSQLTASRSANANVVVLGDAAHVIHPLAGQGLNLGLADAAALVECLGRPSEHWPSPAAIARYQRWRKSEAQAYSTMTAALNRLFRVDNAWVAGLRGVGMTTLDRLPALTHWFAERAMGRAGDLPAAALAPP